MWNNVSTDLDNTNHLYPERSEGSPYIIENTEIDNLTDDHFLLRNRLGWLLEVSGKHPKFKPVKTKNKPIIRAPGSYSDPKAINYLKKIQTRLGKRWHIYDTDLSQIKRSFIGRLSTDG